MVKCYCLLCLLVIASAAKGQTSLDSMAQLMGTRVQSLWPDSLGTDKPAHWNYEQGVVLCGMSMLYMQNRDKKYLDYIRHAVDLFVSDEGNIRTYKAEDYSLDNISMGRALLFLYQQTGLHKYLLAAGKLRDQLKLQPRTPDGGFWHKKIYPQQMWLDGLFMAEPFYAQYAQITGEDSVYNDVVRQFVLMENHARDPATGLLYHGWDYAKKERWADSLSGHSPHAWARAMGWYGAALVDVLDYLPKEHPGRKVLLDILHRFAVAVRNAQDPGTGLWWDVMDKPGAPGNYFEASASCLFVYTLSKAVQKGYLTNDFSHCAGEGFDGIRRRFLKVDADGKMQLDGTVSVSGLGGAHYRDGSYSYYLSERVVPNDPKGVGAFLMAACVMKAN
jgi:unsaturated rhamnogalacturonyl hydrolase